MANTNAPFGFQQRATINGPVNFRVAKKLISSSYGTAIGYGDAVSPVISSATGYIVQSTATTTPIAGIFYGCSYYSTSQKKQVWNNYWPGSDATGDVTAFVCDDPTATFVVQMDSTGATQALVGQNAQLVVGSGTNTTTGYSGMYLDHTTNTTSTFPFIITGLITDPPGANGTAAGAYNLVSVAFNNMLYKAGITGIS